MTDATCFFCSSPLVERNLRLRFAFCCLYDLGSSKKTGKGKRPGKGGNRYFKSIGLGFKTPREATEGSYSLALII